jgi:hypothetical protein
MATAPLLGPDILAAIASQLAERLTEAGQEAVSANRPLEIGESFPIWMLGMASTADPEFAFQSAMPTGYWHHQIRHAGEAREFAKSRPLGPNARDWRVEEIVTSPMAALVDAAIAVLDREVPGDEQIRILDIPAYFVRVFWIGDGKDSRMLLVQKPESVVGLEYGQVYGGYDFLQRLSRNPFVIGVPPDARPR